MKMAAPAEALRRAVGNAGDHLDRLGRIEQVDRAERRFAGLGLGPDRIIDGRDRGKGEHRLFGDMAVLRRKPADTMAAQPGGEAIDEAGEFIVGDCAPFELELERRHDFEHGHGEADKIETEAGIDRIVERVHSLGEQPHQQRHVARGQAGFDAETPDEAVGAE